MRHNTFSNKRWASALTVTSALALMLVALPAGNSFARGLGGGVGGGASLGAGMGGGHVGAGAAVGAGGAGINGNTGGSSSSHISDEGLSNTNGPDSSDWDTGLGRAEDRANEEGLEHGKAFDGSQDQGQDTDTDSSVKGHTSGNARVH